MTQLFGWVDGVLLQAETSGGKYNGINQTGQDNIVLF
jgi:hypothetical protein